MDKFKNLRMEQIALGTFAYSKYSLQYTLDSLERLGAAAIEFYAADPHLSLDDCSPYDIISIGKQLKDHHIQVINVCPENCNYPMNLASKNAATRKRTMECYIRAIQATSEWNCPHCLIFPGLALFDETQELAWPRGIEAMEYLCRIANAYGVQIILESGSANSTVLTGVAKIAKMLDELDSPAISGMLDLMCLEIMQDPIRDAIQILGMERIKHVHFSDAVKAVEGQWLHLVPGEGMLPLEDMLTALDENDYTGYFGCEVFAPYKKEPEKAMQKYLAWCRERFKG